MLHKCANPACSNPFRYLSQGKLYKVETDLFAPSPNSSRTRNPKPSRKVEYYWLCDECSSFLTLAFDRARGMVTVPRPDTLSRKRPIGADVMEMDRGVRFAG
jgi:hypothetical protein